MHVQSDNFNLFSLNVYTDVIEVKFTYYNVIQNDIIRYDTVSVLFNTGFGSPESWVLTPRTPESWERNLDF